ncbi:MAG: bifunctional nuclease family protein [Muribaculaceae bacterium]|nr:bifunctional nuclease family protein [Muribaculaceae bacterium]
MEPKYRLELIGITYNQIESGVYALILQQVGTQRRIPIIIGFPEAQAIECKLQDIKVPRPLTHDIMIDTLQSFGIYLESVMIKKLPNGVFAADLYLTDGFNIKVIDARSSDAVALAIRANAPIYTTEDVLMEAGFDPTERTRENTFSEESSKSKSQDTYSPSFNRMTLEQLEQAMNEAVENENYEQAARIKAEIEYRKK